jgi:cysteinylglycine-S-conjugate dipeptidase
MPDEVRAKVGELMRGAREDLARLVSFRSVADPKLFPPEECTKAAQYVVDAFSGAGLQDVRLMDTPDGHPAVYGHRPGPPGAPTVLLYSHYDVQPPLDEVAWRSPPFELTERGGRWYGRGAADCKGNVVVHLTALRALDGRFPVGIKFICEGAEEQGTGGLEAFVPENAELLQADAILVCDAGNVAVGVPTLTTSLRGVVNVLVTVRTLAGAMHSGMFGGPAPDALAALIRMLASLWDERGNATIDGLDAGGRWGGAQYPPEQFRQDATVLEGVDLVGDGTVSDLLWARPAVTVLGIDCPPVAGSAAAIPPEARARVSLRIPPETEPAAARQALIDHLRAVAPWNARVEVEPEGIGAPFQGSTGGPAYSAMEKALREAYGREPTTAGQGGSIPLCNVLHDTFPEAEIMLIGVEEPSCLIHAPNESVDPSELEAMALTEALFFRE